MMSTKESHIPDNRLPAAWRTEKPITVLHFVTTWSGAAQMMSSVLDCVSKKFSGKMHCWEVNAETHQGLFNRFNLRKVPSILIFHHGEPIKSISGMVPEARLSTLIGELLAQDGTDAA